jgi:GH18 family chitinase
MRLCVVALCSLGCIVPSAVPSTPTPPSAFRVVGYLPSWSEPRGPIPYGQLTHINWAFVLPTADGGLTPLEGADRLKSVVDAAHAQKVKVCLSIGGWNDGNDSAFEKMAAAPNARRAFVDAVAAIIDAHQLDGVDIDWEYPDPGASARNFLALMQELSARLRPRGKLLTAAVVAQGEQGEGVVPAVFPVTDFINIMAYDADESGRTNHSPYEYALSSLRYWRRRGLAQDKAVLGVPFYGRKPDTSYRELVARDAQAAKQDQLGTVLYNGQPTIRRKTELALLEGSGVMIWEITEDTTDQTSLLKAINETVGSAAGARR